MYMFVREDMKLRKAEYRVQDHTAKQLAVLGLESKFLIAFSLRQIGTVMK